MPRVINDYFPKSELEIEPFDQLADISDVFQLTLSRMMALYEAGNQFRLLRVNSSNELLVSLEAGQVSTGTIGRVTVSTIAILLLGSNTARKTATLFNNGSEDIYIGFTSGVTTATGFILPAGMSWSTDVYIGNIYGIKSAGIDSAIHVMEF